MNNLINVNKCSNFIHPSYSLHIFFFKDSVSSINISHFRNLSCSTFPPRSSVEYTLLCVFHSPSLAVLGATALVLVAAEREGGFALRLGHFTGQMNERLDKCSSVGH